MADVEHHVESAQAAEAARRLAAGELEDAFLPAFWPVLIRRYAREADGAGRLRANPWGESLCISLNLTQPPFDDVHVRRALSWVIDEAALRDAYGGRLAGPIAQHVVPDELLDDELEGFAPFKSRGDHGDLARAKAEMAKSKYARRNGVCIAKACKGVSHRLGRARTQPSQRIAADRHGECRQDRHRRSSTARRPPDRPSSNNPVLVNVQWVTPVARPVELLRPALRGRRHRPERQPQLLAPRAHAGAGGQARA